MNEAMALSRDWGMASAREALALPGSISEDATKQLPTNVEVLMKTTHGLLENCILSAIEKRSGAEFALWRDESFPQYFNAVLGLAALVKFAVPQQVIERINRDFFCELEADLRDKGRAAFGSAVQDQAIFTAWTLRKTSDLIAQLPASPKMDAATAASVSEIGGSFILHAIRTRFHLHCLVTSMRLKKAIYPDPLELIIDGLRSAVNAYAQARCLLDLVSPLPEPKTEPLEWDDEDAALLAEASRDMQGEFA
jgi:hypothetical protein